jgi:hypothetical protein
MKVVCIENSWGNSRHLEIGGIYDVVSTNTINHSKGFSVNYIIILTEPWTSLKNMEKRLHNKMEICVDKNCFISLDEWRKIKIDEFLNLSKLEGNLD